MLVMPTQVRALVLQLKVEVLAADQADAAERFVRVHGESLMQLGRAALGGDDLHRDVVHVGGQQDRKGITVAQVYDEPAATVLRVVHRRQVVEGERAAMQQFDRPTKRHSGRVLAIEFNSEPKRQDGPNELPCMTQDHLAQLRVHPDRVATLPWEDALAVCQKEVPKLGRTTVHVHVDRIESGHGVAFGLSGAVGGIVVVCHGQSWT